MGYDYKEELERAKEYRKRQKEEAEAAMEERQAVERTAAMETAADWEEEPPRPVTGAASERSEHGGFTSLGSVDIGEPGSRSRARSNAQNGRTNGHSQNTGSGRPNGQKPKKNKTRRRIIITIIAEIFALLFIFGYAYVYKTYNKSPKLEFPKKEIQNQELTAEDLKKMKGYWMIAIFGVDSRSNNVGAGTHADVNMICCINQDTGDIKLVSVFRDTYLNIDEKNTYNKINAAYFNGGPSQAVAALNKNLDLNITDYITFNWKAVADAINILGGVDLDISRAEFKYINSFITETVKSTGVGSNHLKKAGPNHLDGVQAVAYGRLRLMDNDYARTERQRKIIQLAFEKAKKADYSVLNNILVVVLEQVSHSLSFTDLTNMALSISKYKLGDTAGFPMQRGEANMGKKGAMVVPATLESNVVRLHQFLFGDEAYTTTESVKKISAKIASDTGIYKEGQVIGHVSTEGYLPKETKAETTAEVTTEATTEETTTVGETDANGRPLPTTPTRPTESSSIHPGIGETDANGDLIDGPEDIFPTTSEPGNRPTQATKPVERPTQATRPGPADEVESSPSHPGDVPETTAPITPGGSTKPTSPIRPGDVPETTQAQTPGGPGDGTQATIPGGPGGGGATTPGGPGDITSSGGPGM